MFKVIGAVVVYGLALYGLIEGLDQLEARIDKKRPASKRSEQDGEGAREAMKRNEAGSQA